MPASDFIVQAQNPAYRCGQTISDAMHKEHLSNSMVEGMFVLHNNKTDPNANSINGFTDSDVISLLKG